MVDFTEEQVEDIKDGFDLYDRTGEGKLFYNQVGDLIRGLGFKPTNKDVAVVLGNPKKEEMNTKTCNFDSSNRANNRTCSVHPESGRNF